MEYSSALKQKKILSYATTWINLEDIILNDISSHRRVILYDSTYMRYLKLSKSPSQEVEWWLTGTRGREEGSAVQWYKVSLIQADYWEWSSAEQQCACSYQCCTMHYKPLQSRAHVICSHHNKNI